jgi:hypothetical protein
MDAQDTFQKQAIELTQFAVASSNSPKARDIRARIAARPYRMLAEAYYIAAYNGLVEWNIKLQATDEKRAGWCDWPTKTITLVVSEMTSDEKAHDTVLHELAHALQIVHHGTAHDACLTELRRQYPRSFSEPQAE